MVIWPASRMVKYRVNDHPYHAPQFKPNCLMNFKLYKTALSENPYKSENPRAFDNGILNIDGYSGSIQFRQFVAPDQVFEKSLANDKISILRFEAEEKFNDFFIRFRKELFQTLHYDVIAG